MSDVHGVARDQLRAFIERIERLEEEKKTIADDIKDVYGEAKGVGFDTKILRKLISIRKQDRDERMEQEAILDMYMIALGMIDGDYGDDEPRQSVHVQRQALRSDASLSIASKPTDFPASDGSPSVSSELTTRSAEGSVVSHSESVAAASKGEAVKSTEPRRVSLPVDEVSSEGSDAGGENVESSAPRAGQVPTSNPGEGAASALPDKPKHRLRPNCLQPEMCKSGTTDHCWSCKKAMAEKSEVAA